MCFSVRGSESAHARTSLIVTGGAPSACGFITVPWCQRVRDQPALGWSQLALCGPNRRLVWSSISQCVPIEAIQRGFLLEESSGSEGSSRPEGTLGAGRIDRRVAVRRPPVMSEESRTMVTPRLPAAAALKPLKTFSPPARSAPRQHPTPPHGTPTALV